MAMWAGELAEVGAEIEVALVVDDDRDETNRRNSSMGSATDFGRSASSTGTSGGRRRDRLDGRRFTADGATGICNVATPPQHRGRGYGAALTARAVRDGFEAGSEFGSCSRAKWAAASITASVSATWRNTSS